MLTAQVWKFPLDMTDGADVKTVVMPAPAKVLHVASQTGADVTIWALVWPETDERITRRFRVAGTGHPLDDEVQQGKFLGTAILRQLSLVFHVWELS